MPSRIVAPSSVEDVVSAVQFAANAGLAVKAIGTGHSFTPVAMTDGVLIDLAAIEGILAVDRDRRRVTVGAGTVLRDLNRALARIGLALENLGDIEEQTIAGAIGTGTHGTGLAFGSLSAQVVGVQFVDGQGNVVSVSDDQQPELVAALALSVGVLGVVVAVELQCVLAFALAAVESGERFDDIAYLHDVAREVDHVEAYWWPHTDILSTKNNDRLPLGSTYTPPGSVANFVEDDLLGTAAHWLMCQLSSARPAVTPKLNALAGSVYGRRSFTDVSHAVFTTARRVRFREMEFGIPAAAVFDAMVAVRATLERLDEQLSFPIEIRFAAADDRWLSTAFGRETAYIAVHRYWRDDPRRVFSQIERVLWDFEALPHWGKVHAKGAAELAPRIPKFDDFVALQQQLDPAGIFHNAHSRHLFGH